jgi:hypothetical protein
MGLGWWFCGGQDGRLWPGCGCSQCFWVAIVLTGLVKNTSTRSMILLYY